jgi:hypothetical protein
MSHETAETGVRSFELEAGALPIASPGVPPRATARRHAMPFGATLRPDGRVEIRLWAPSHARIDLVLDGDSAAIEMLSDGGWHMVTTERAREGSRYRFRLPDGSLVPDPGGPSRRRSSMSFMSAASPLPGRSRASPSGFTISSPSA